MNTLRTRLLVRALLGALVLLLLWQLLGGIEYVWNWEVPWRYRALYMQGMVYTVVVSVAAICLGLVVGIAAGLARVWPNMLLQEIAGLYVACFRGTPLLVQIYIFYFCLAAVIRFQNALVIGTVCLACFSGAYIAEMVRAGVESIDAGQWEAARSTGMRYGQAMRYVIFPQAFRRIIPPVTGQFVSLIKDSSLLSVIAMRELTKASEVVNATTYKTFEAYLPLAVLYLLLTYPFSLLAQHLERRMSNGSARSKSTGGPGRGGGDVWG
ncbi:MAG: amino acid ABC transporter permease [Desulfovibrio sp.]|nr:amino acid ABC transporter permease [Desulfovibrio sp.]